MATIEGIDLGNLQTEEVNQSAGVTQMALPDSKSSDAMLIPTTGPTVKISLSGIYTGNLTSLRAFISNLADWITKGGDLNSQNLEFIGDLNPGPFSIRVTDGNWKWEAGDPNKISWSLSLLEGQFA